MVILDGLEGCLDVLLLDPPAGVFHEDCPDQDRRDHVLESEESVTDIADDDYLKPNSWPWKAVEATQTSEAMPQT